MNQLRNQKGITIVEIMVAAVILVISAIALLGLYSQNFGWIVGSGYRTNALDEAKASLDSAISVGAATDTESITIAFGSGAPAITVLGQNVSATGTDGPGDSISVSLNTFLPYVSP